MERREKCSDSISDKKLKSECSKISINSKINQFENIWSNSINICPEKKKKEQKTSLQTQEKDYQQHKPAGKG